MFPTIGIVWQSVEQKTHISQYRCGFERNILVGVSVVFLWLKLMIEAAINRNGRDGEGGSQEVIKPRYTHRGISRLLARCL